MGLAGIVITTVNRTEPIFTGLRQIILILSTAYVYLYSKTNRWFDMLIMQVYIHKEFDGILPKGPYPPCLRMADRALLTGYPRISCIVCTLLWLGTGDSFYSYCAEWLRWHSWECPNINEATLKVMVNASSNFTKKSKHNQNRTKHNKIMFSFFTPVLAFRYCCLSLCVCESWVCPHDISLLPEASYGLRVLSLPASVCVCVYVCVCVRQSWVCPRDNSSPV